MQHYLDFLGRRHRSVRLAFDWEDYCVRFVCVKEQMKVSCALRGALAKQTVISLSGNLVFSATDITDECNVRLKSVGGGGGRGGMSHRLQNTIM